MVSIGCAITFGPLAFHPKQSQIPWNFDFLTFRLFLALKSARTPIQTRKLRMVVARGRTVQKGGSYESCAKGIRFQRVSIGRVIALLLKENPNYSEKLPPPPLPQSRAPHQGGSQKIKAPGLFFLRADVKPSPIPLFPCPFPIPIPRPSGGLSFCGIREHLLNPPGSHYLHSIGPTPLCSLGTPPPPPLTRPRFPCVRWVK